jgi:hypothetical protein
LQVVEHEHERPRLGEDVEQRANCAVAAIALVLERNLLAAGQRPERWEEMGELRLGLSVELSEPPRLQACDVLVKRIDEHGERQVALEFRRRSVEDEVPAQLRSGTELPEEPRLADSWFTEQCDCTGMAIIELVEKPLE